MFKYLPNILADIQLWIAVIIAYLVPFLYMRFRIQITTVASWLLAGVLGITWVFGLTNFFYLTQDPENFHERYQIWAAFFLVALYLVISMIGVVFGNEAKNR